MKRPITPSAQSDREEQTQSSPAASQLTRLLDLDAELAALSVMSLAQMRAFWQQITDKPVPRVRGTLLQLAIAWELQVAVHGGLPRRTEQRLAYLAGKSSSDQKPAPGMRLVREWNGVLHTVTIDEDGQVHWNGKTWRSLSEVARAITGTRWSGPAFFGLKQRARAA